MPSAVTEQSQRNAVAATKSVFFMYSSSNELCSLFEDFRCMTNDAIRIAVKERPRNRFKLIQLAYPRLKECDIVWDRDDLASKNVMACVVPQARPPNGSCEGERGGDGSNPPSRWREGRVGG